MDKAFVKKEVSIGTLIASVGLLLSVGVQVFNFAVFYGTVSTQIGVINATLHSRSQYIDRLLALDGDYTAFKREIYTRLQSMDNKLDFLVREKRAELLRNRQRFSPLKRPG